LVCGWLDGSFDAREVQALRQEDRLRSVFPDINGSPLQQLRATVLNQLRQAKNDQDVLKAIKMASTASASRWPSVALTSNQKISIAG